jgi:hypothetical protein
VMTPFPAGCWTRSGAIPRGESEVGQDVRLGCIHQVGETHVAGLETVGDAAPLVRQGYTGRVSAE